MLIFGTYVIHRTLGEGHFMCPQCMGVTSYRVRRGRWFFHILFIPLIPMKKTPPHVECLTCKQKFALGVLGPDAEQYREGAQPPPLEQMMQVPQQPVQQQPYAQQQGFVPPPPYVAPVPVVDAAVPPVAPQAQPHVVPGAGDLDLFALLRGLTAEVLRRADAVTDDGVASAAQTIRRRCGVEAAPENVRQDVATLDASYVTGQVRSAVAAGTLPVRLGQELTMEATLLARRNGGITERQWQWIVAFASDAGLDPAATEKIRELVLQG